MYVAPASPKLPAGATALPLAPPRALPLRICSLPAPLGLVQGEAAAGPIALTEILGRVKFVKRVRCQLCDRPDRAGIDSALIAGHSFGEIALRFHVGKQAVFRHKQHVKVTPVTPEFDALDAASVLRYVARNAAELGAEARRLGLAAEAKGDHGAAIKAVGVALTATLSLRDGLQWLQVVPVELPLALEPAEALERARALVTRLEGMTG